MSFVTKSIPDFVVRTLALLLLVSAIACDNAIQPPAPVPFENIYEHYASLKVQNPTALAEKVKSKEVRSLKGTIWRIDGKSLKFLIEEGKVEKLLLEGSNTIRDAYVECEFPEENDVVHFKIGQQVEVYGKLNKAFDKGRLGFNGDARALKLKDCAPYPSP